MSRRRALLPAGGLLLVGLLCLLAYGRPWTDPFERSFEQLKQPRATVDAEHRNRLIREGFLAEPSAGLPFVLEKLLREPASPTAEEVRARRADARVAREILARMPVEAQAAVASRTTGSPYQEARLLEATGRFRTPAALDRLVRGLSDRREADTGVTADGGWPLRVCDVAYNTLVLRLRLSDFRSPLGIAHSHAQRDRWIERLDRWLDANQEIVSAAFSSPR